VRTWLNGPAAPKGPNFDGVVEGTISVAGAFGPATGNRQPATALTASATLSRLEVYPLEVGEQKAAADRFTLRNEGPILLTLAKSAITVTRAHFTGPSSDVNVTGA